MKRVVVLLTMLALIAVIGGMMPASAGPPGCQVVATVAPKSCSFVATSYSVNAIILGTGNVSVYDSFGFRSAVYCPLAGAKCLGGANSYVAPGYRVVLTVNIGVGRVSTGLP